MSVFSLGELFAQASCERTGRVEVSGITISTYNCSDGCSYTTFSERNEQGELEPIVDIPSC